MKKKVIGLITFFLLLTAFSAFQTEAQEQSKKPNKEAEKLAKQGDEFFKKKDFRSAINKYAEAISKASNYPYAHFWKGYAHRHLKEYDESLLELDTAHKQGYAPLEVYKIRLFVNLQKGDYDAALKDAQEGAQIEPNNIDFQRGLADAYLGKKDYQNALVIYKKLAEADPNNADIWFYIAKANYYLGKTSEQEFAANDAIKKHTQFLGEAWFYVADSLQKGKKYDEAIDAYENSITANPKVYDAYNNLSELYRTKGLYDKAIATMDKALVHFPNDSTLHANLSWYYNLSNKPADAFKHAKKATDLDSSNAMGYKNLCRANNDLKSYDLAVIACNKALELNPGDGESNFYLGWAYNEQGDKQKRKQYKELASKHFKEAVEGLSKFTKENPDNSDSFYLLGNAHYQAGNPEDAVAAYKKAIELRPRFARALYNLGMVYIAQKKPELTQEQVNELEKIGSKLAVELRKAINQK